MSEANTGTSGVDNSPAPAGSPAASLYPEGGGNKGAGLTPVAPVGETGGVTGSDTTPAPAGAETQTGGAGNDTISGAETATGTESGTGNDTIEGGEGNDTVAGTEGNDTLTADSYKDKIKLPEGFIADDAMMGEAATLFADVGVPPDKAQGLIDLFAKVTKANNDKATADYQAQQTAWLGEIDKMPEFQGEARATSLQAIGKVFDEYGTPEARAALDAFGTGNNPALVKMFHKIAQALSEGTPTGQGQPRGTGADGKPVDSSGRGKTVGQRLYPDQK